MGNPNQNNFFFFFKKKMILILLISLVLIAQSLAAFCTGKVNGHYCCADKTCLIYCQNNKDNITPCAHGCAPQPPGTPDVCHSAPGKGWITKAGKYTVERINRQGRAGRVSFTSTVNKFLLHTIEGRAGPGDYGIGTRVLDGIKAWPHFIVALDDNGKMRIGQYLPMTEGGRALRAPGNNLGTIQVEIGAKAASPFTQSGFKYQAVFTEAVAMLFAAVRAAVPSIPNKIDSRVQFKGSGSYGTNAPQRLSTSVFTAVGGLVGHQHCPSNTHWDPGAIDPRKLLAKPTPRPTPRPTPKPTTKAPSATPKTTKATTTTMATTTTAAPEKAFCDGKAPGLYCDDKRVVQCDELYVGSIDCQIDCETRSDTVASCVPDDCVGKSDGPHCDASNTIVVKCKDERVTLRQSCETDCVETNGAGACEAESEPCEGKDDGQWCFDLNKLTQCKGGKSTSVEVCAQGCDSVYEQDGKCRDATGVESCPAGVVQCACKADGSCNEGLEAVSSAGRCRCTEPYFQFEQAQACPHVDPIHCKSGLIVYAKYPSCLAPECPPGDEKSVSGPQESSSASFTMLSYFALVVVIVLSI